MVVAIIGILSAIGTLTYSGYVKAAKRSSAENIMQQVSLAQTEEYSLTGEYWRSGAQDTTTCSANDKDASIALEAAFYKVWLGNTDPYQIHACDMVFPSYWGQSYIRGNKQIEIFGILQSDRIYSFEEIFKEAKEEYIKQEI